MAEKQEKYNKPFRLYKMRKTGNGVASQFDLGSKKDAIFLEMADQIGEVGPNNTASFDWKNKVGFKLGVSDLGEMLAVLSGKQDGAGPIHPETGKHRGLFHQNDDGNSILYFTRGKSTGFYMKLSIKKKDIQKEFQHTITDGEGASLETLLKHAILIIYNWC